MLLNGLMPVPAQTKMSSFSFDSSLSMNFPRGPMSSSLSPCFIKSNLGVRAPSGIIFMHSSSLLGIGLLPIEYALRSFSSSVSATIEMY